MRVLLTTYVSRGYVDRMVGSAVWLRALGAEGFGVPAAGGRVPTGVWR